MKDSGKEREDLLSQNHCLSQIKSEMNRGEYENGECKITQSKVKFASKNGIVIAYELLAMCTLF